MHGPGTARTGLESITTQHLPAGSTLRSFGIPRTHRCQVGRRPGGARFATRRRLVVQERFVEWAQSDWAVDGGQWKRVLGSENAQGNRRLRHQVPQPHQRGLGVGWHKVVAAGAGRRPCAVGSFVRSRRWGQCAAVWRVRRGRLLGGRSPNRGVRTRRTACSRPPRPAPSSAAAVRLLPTRRRPISPAGRAGGCRAAACRRTGSGSSPATAVPAES